MTLMLNRSDMARLLDWPSVIDAVEQGFRDFSAGAVVQPARSVIRSIDPPGAYLLMPCAIAASQILGTKIATVYPKNSARALPTIAALYLLADHETGMPLAVMDAGYMTAMRTAASTVVATRALANPDPCSIGVFGTGTQAEFHIRALTHVYPRATVVVVGSTPEKTTAFVGSVKSLDADIRPGSAKEAACCEVVVAATSATAPVFDGAWLRPGTHVNGVGSHQPGIRELDSTTITRSRVIADSLETLWAEAGDLLIPEREGAIGRDHVLAELGQVIDGSRAGRTSAEQITLFKSNGVAFQDAVTASLAYERARREDACANFDFGG